MIIFAIATAGDFAEKALILPILDIFKTTYSLIEIIMTAIPPEHPEFIYGLQSLLLWITKLLSSIIATTASNQTLVMTFNSTISTIEANSLNFFGNLSGESGMSYLAKHAYYRFLNNSTLNTEAGLDFARFINATLHYVSKAFAMVS